MPSKEQVTAKINNALNEKTGGQKPCNVCNQTKWVVIDKFTTLSVNNDPSALALGGEIMSMVPLVCANCGNTHLINLKVLGFQDLSELKIDE